MDAQHTLVVLNTPWWLYADDQPKRTSGCEALDPAAVMVLLDDILRRNYAAGKQVVVAGYHAIYKTGSYVQQAALPNPGYRLLCRVLRRTLERYPGLAYVSGQGRHPNYHELNGVHYLVSGSTARVTWRDNTPQPAGLMRLDYAMKDTVRATYWAPAAGQTTNRPLFNWQWLTPTSNRPKDNDTTLIHSFRNQTVVVQASTQYEAGRVKKWLQGTNYRREWEQRLTVPVLDLGTAEGGLIPLKRGGGLQTKALRLRARSGQEYVLRAVEKNTTSSVPPFLRHTFATAIVQDQISAAHPYAALAVPTLAEAAGVGHSNPQLVYVPNDPRLGLYRPEFAGTLALLEAREPTPPSLFTGQPERKNYSTADVLAALEADARNRVDQRAVLRARLLDMLLGDWDRHEDQWRWLAYPLSGGGKRFRAVPRDRDQAFFVNQGLLPREASMDFLLPRIQGFHTGFRNINTFNYQARYFDRSFLTELRQADWRAVADSVQAGLSDAVLLKALHQWPDSIYQLSGPTILAKLRAHRNDLPSWANKYYLFLAEGVDVVGSNQGEYFDVVRQNDAQTQVRMYARTAAGQRGALLYNRTFFTAETREIRLYGQGGDDLFTVSGRVSTGSVVRIIGGTGADSLIDRSQVGASRRKTVAYDEPQGLTMVGHAATRLHLNPAESTRTYDRESFQYPILMPLMPCSYNVDDGIFLGWGVGIKRPGFRKSPWAATHALTGNVALATGAFSFAYNGLLTQAIGRLDVQLQALVEAPNYVRNFYGLGNNTQPIAEQPLSYYRVRFRNVATSVMLRRALTPRWQVFGGVQYQAVEVEDQADRILHQLSDDRLRPASLFADKQYAGLQLGLEMTSLHAKAAWPQGAHWRTELTLQRPLTAAARPLTQLNSELALYRSFRLPFRLTLASRFGGTANFGDYEFFQAATLGGLSNLRGFRRTRFAGRQSLYNNLEARLQLGSFSTVVLPLTFGVLAFHDVGRVWVPGEDSLTWHRGYGGGLWVSPKPLVTLTAMYGLSSTEQLLLARLGFFF
ncbi:metallophosphoesterase [Hymenobacter segetis]